MAFEDLDEGMYYILKRQPFLPGKQQQSFGSHDPEGPLNIMKLFTWKESRERKNMESKEMVRLACEAMEDKKAQDIKIIDIEKVSTLADYFIIASGSNRNQVQAMADSVSEKLGRAGVEPKQMEGYQTANWILLDYRDVVIHIFDEENRLFYDLERIWRDGTLVNREDFE